MEQLEGVGASGLKTKLIINYLPQSMTDQQFRMLFSQIGPLENSKIMRDRGTDYSFGYGFVDFIEPRDAVEAINKLNGHRLENKVLRVAYSKPPGSSKNVNLYVGGLGAEVTEDKLLMLFSNHGDVISTKVLKDRDGSSKGAGFVLFKSKNDADAAIRALQGYVDGYGSSFQIKQAKDAAEQQKSHPKYQEFIQSKFGGYQQQQPESSPYGYSAASRGGYEDYEEPSYNSYGANYLPYGSSNLSGAQRPMRGRGAGGRGGVGARGGSRGGSFHDGAIRGGGARGGGARFNPMARPVGNASQYSGNGYGNDYGINEEPVTKVFVYNIGMHATEGDVYALFGKHGRINKVDVMTGKGYAFVHMPLYDEAVEAVRSLNRQPYNGKELQVSIKT